MTLPSLLEVTVLSSQSHLSREQHPHLYSRLVLLVALSLLAVTTRALPYAISLLPFNNDGMTEARIARDILSAGHLTYPEGSFYADTHSTVTIAYNVVVAFASSSIGVDTYTISQSLIAVLSVLTIVGVYVIALKLSGSYVGALSAAFVLAFLGTFVFLTGSAWKGALGVALLILLTFAYMGRSDRRYLILEVAILAILPLAHHLVTILAYLMLAHLTSWSLLVAIRKKRFSRRHIIDVAIIFVASAFGYVYYSEMSFEKLSDYGTTDSVVAVLTIWIVLTCAMTVVLLRKGSLKISFASAAGSLVAIVVILDFYNPAFPYARGYESTIPALAVMYGLVVAFGWFGFELLSRSKSRYHAIPFGLLLPVLTVLLFALITGLDLESHKMFYRTFDYADISFSLGAGFGVAYLAKGKHRYLTVGVLTIVLLCSFPYGYATSTLLGDRHDSQEYEADAIKWIHDNVGPPSLLSSDERLSYDAQALFDFGKDPYLPSRLVLGVLSPSDVMNVLLEEWMVTGVNDYPRGHPILDDDYVNQVIEDSNVLYVGGPASNNLIVFQTSTVP